ncbi:MAG: DnaD domain protein [Bacilli bacterium]|nr:DnaD domain protein [Bacilli bacterium]
MDGEKPNYYAVIPAEVRYDSDLRANEKILYGEITALADKSGECYASNNYFAELYGVTPQAISKWIINLKDKEYVDITYVNKGKMIEKRMITITPKCTNRYQQILIGYQQKFEENKEEEEYNNNIFELIENNLNRVLSPIEYEVIKKWDYSYEIIELAIKEAILHNAKTIKYIDRILFNWKQNNVETLEDAKKYLDEYSNKVKPKEKKETKVFNPYRNLDDE